MRTNTSHLLLLGLVAALSSNSHVKCAEKTAAPAVGSITYNQDVRPILSANCFQCHGRDEAARQADVRLDVPGQADLTAVLDRITSVDGGSRMPPPEVHDPLSAEQVEILRRWIAAGAPYQQHWSFVPPKRPDIPANTNTQWSEHAIDRFVLARLVQKELSPSPAADKRTIIRRLSLDLTGLPPTVSEIQEFINDQSLEALEHLVDRLLEKPQFGEHLARYWLDLVRFADTNGLHHDHYREMTPYRDWVIRAFNDNLPFDEFIVAQIAGDLNSQPTVDQQIASGFNRLHLIIDRGTMLPEESFTRNVVDQVSAIGTAFLGLTLECAVCHDHKYDPISQRDFYQLFAFFNNFDGEPETGSRSGTDFVRGLQPPYLELPSPAQSEQLAKLDAELLELTAKIETLKAKEASSQTTANADGSADGAEAGHMEELNQLTMQLENGKKARDSLLTAIPATLVMKERNEIRPAHLLIRGNYDQPGEIVERDTPRFLPPVKSQGAIKTRLDLAQWLVSSEHPLTARVAVNRFWQQLFGVGLVKSSEDFGSQGEAPSHPELLDYLAIQFIDSGWNVKSLLRSIVLSRTYGQSSNAVRTQYASDPNNRLLARGSRYRLDAEVIRDQILFTCGLLNTSLYGKSVKPPQPAGLWETVAMPSSYPNVYVADEGDKIYRRSVYTFWKRAIPPPQMSIFDAPTRESCVARRERTNTPLQALVIMNEQQYFAAAMSFAQSLLNRHELNDTQRLQLAYETLTSRLPNPEAIAILSKGWEQFRSFYKGDLQAAQEMVQESAAPAIAAEAKRLNPAQTIELAAFSMVVHSMLNLDVTRNRE